jgi:hypothetical protein
MHIIAYVYKIYGLPRTDSFSPTRPKTILRSEPHSLLWQGFARVRFNLTLV